MSTSAIIRRGALTASLVAASALAPALTSWAATTKAKRPVAITGRVAHVLSSSAVLDASIDPNGIQTSYFFQYGPTPAYGSQTPTVVVGDGTSKVKVGQAIAGLKTGLTYYYRVVAVTSSGEQIAGRERSFIVGKTKTKLELPRSAVVVVGTPFLISGTLSGLGNAHQELALQASTYPYSEAFKALGAPTFTGPTGQFSFAATPITASTEYRVVTLGLRPLYSRTEVVHAQLKVVLHVRTSAVPGLVRLYGTVAPAAIGAQVLLQVHEGVKPAAGKPGAQATARFVTQFGTVVKKGGKTFSRFSVIAKVRVGGRYRAVVKLRAAGPLVTGYSPTLVLRASPKSAKKAKPKAKS